MTLTNKFNLPQSIVNAIKNDKYSSRGADFSVTGLLSPPYQRHLMRNHEYSEDVSDRVFALLGQAVHTILERGKGEGDIVEARYTLPVQVGDKEYSFSGQCDLLSGGALYDFKITTTYKKAGSPDWTAQLNMLRWLIEENEKRDAWFEGRDPKQIVTRLGIIAIYRDWSKREATFDAQYPQAQAEIIPVEMWPLEKTLAFIVERMKAHLDSDPPVCSDDERWARPGKFAVMKKGQKRAVKLFDNADEAHKMVEKLGADHSVDERPKSYPRCENYCPVSKHCQAWLGAKGEK